MRGMKLGLARGAVFIGAALGMSSGAFAAAGLTSATVEALSPVRHLQSRCKPAPDIRAHDVSRHTA